MYRRSRLSIDAENVIRGSLASVMTLRGRFRLAFAFVARRRMGRWSWTAPLQCGCGGRGLAGVPEQVGVQQDAGGTFVDAWTLDDAEATVGVQGDLVLKFEPVEYVRISEGICQSRGGR